jgi:putative tricarboxylic transport membrane protein
MTASVKRYAQFSPDRKMKRNDIVGAVFFLAVGVVFALYARSVDIGDWSEPGPGFLPIYGALAMIGLALLLVVRRLAGRPADAPAAPFFPENDSWKRVSSTLLALVAYNLLLRPLGFVTITFLFVAFLVKCIFPQSWVRSLTTAALSTICAHVVFVKLLEINFPKGILGF